MKTIIVHSPRSCYGRRNVLSVRGVYLAALMMLLSIPLLHAQSRENTGADTVVSFTPGVGSGIGREPQYFPWNVLGLPDSSARESVPSINPVQILSLGVGGEITLRFDRHTVVDGPGPDFAVFENAFHYILSGTQRTYAEPATVSVSRDGVTFVSFPFDSLTLAGCAGVTPTNGEQDPRDPAVSGGDLFDLSTIGVDSIRYVRIHDVTPIVRDNRKHPFWDPTLNGFDLDAVVAINVAVPRTPGKATTGAAVAALIDSPERATVRCTLEHPAHARLRLFNPLGQQVALLLDSDVPAGSSLHPFSLSRIVTGPYFIALEADGVVIAMTPLHLVR